MKMHKIVYFFLAAILISACVKNNEPLPQPPHHPISDEFRLYAAFDTNSYWVFQEAETGIVDTLRVVSVTTERRFHQDNTTDETGFHYDAMNISFESDELGFVRYEITAGSQESDATMMYESLRAYFSSGRYFRMLMPRFANGDTQLLGEQEGNYTNLERIESYALNDRSYEEVFHTSVVDYLNAPDTVYMEFFIARQYGLIRYTADGPNTSIDWSLMDAMVHIVEE